MNLSGKAVMMVILTMLMMKRITSMTMTEIMMVMTMMVVMLHITDFLLKRRKRNRFVCLFFQIICMSDSQLFKRKLLMELIINPLGFHCFLRDKTCKETTRQVERVSIPGFRLECRIVIEKSSRRFLSSTLRYVAQKR